MGGLLELAGYGAAVLVLVGGLMAITHILGERHFQRGTGTPYESGVPPTGSARLRFAADFFLVAMFFVIFDISALFIFAWAVAARELGWAGYVAILVFMIETVAGLAYLWRMGAFDWVKGRMHAYRERHGWDNASRP